MKIKKILAAVSACAVAAVSMAFAGTFSVGAAAVVGKAIIAGQMGVYTQWDTTTAYSNQSTVAEIDGNAQYEATWDITGNGTSSIDILMLEISGADANNENLKDFTNVKYPNLKVTIDGVWIDGVKFDAYTTSADATNYNYYDNNLGKTRVYLSSTQSTPQLCNDVPSLTPVSKQIKVLFTVSGMDTVGTSNVKTDTTETTTSANPLTSETTTTTVDPNALISQTTIGNQGGFGNVNTNVSAATTGDGGVAAVAIAGLVVTAVAAVLSKVKFKGRKKK